MHFDGALLVKGMVLGFSIAAPVGPIGVLCIRRTLTGGRKIGWVSGLGAATADAFYGVVAGFGLTFLSGPLLSQREWLGLIGGVYLCFLGIRTFTAAPSGEANVIDSRGIGPAYLSTLLLTITNPVTILSFAAFFAGFGLTGNGDYGGAGLLVLGVFTGSMLWWSILIFGVGLFRTRITFDGLKAINRLSGVILSVFGVLALVGLLK